jgi:protein SCO1/2
MKPKYILSLLIVLTLGAMVSAVAFGPLRRAGSTPASETVRTYEVRGTIRSIDPESRVLRIAHEEIPGYMTAMTMPFEVRDNALLKGLRPGDDVQFELSVTDDDSWISRITTKSVGALSAQVPMGSLQDRESNRVQAGESVPDFALIDQDGRTFNLSDYRGKPVVLTFIYTRCPIPNFCPLMSKNFADLQQRLARDHPGRAALLSVTIDPGFDRPEILRAYAARYQADPAHWTFATGTEEQVHFVAELFGLFREPENGLISHDLRTALIGPDGRLVHLWKSNAWTPYEIQRRVVEVLESSQLVSR